MEWHLATLNFICQSASHCPKLVRSSCRVKQSWIEYTFLYRTQSSANRQTEDLMFSGKSFIKIRNRIGPKTDPWGTPDNTGTCGWILLSHNSPIYVIASCVALYQRPLRNPLWSNLSVCVHDSQPHPGCWWCRAQTGPTGFRRTSDLETMLTVSKYAI